MTTNLIHCLVCTGKSFLLKRLKESGVYKCASCGLEFCDPMPSEDRLREFYVNYSNPRANPRITQKNAQKNIRYLKKYGLSEDKKLLDFGCGDNFFVKCGNSEKWMGYDKYTFPEFPNGQFDFITLWGVLEHLTTPAETMNYLSQKMKQEGKIVITTVGTNTGIPYQYKFPEHVTWWNKDSIEYFLNSFGIKIKEISPYFMYQDSKVYLDCILNAGKVPKELKKEIIFKTKKDVYVPTNEIFIVGEKK